MTNKNSILGNLQSLYTQEEFLRGKALEIVEQDEKLLLHLLVTERAMDLADLLRQLPTDDEDTKVIQMLGMRTFNAFGASLKLALSGYVQNSALIMRDILETAFLLSLFSGDHSLVKLWRTSDRKERLKKFSPVRVREALDKRDGVHSKKRAEMYEMFSELAGHPNMKAIYMMRPQKDGDAVIGPFMEATALQATIAEMGRLAVQVGESLDSFLPKKRDKTVPARLAFMMTKGRWVKTFYPNASKAQN